MDEGSYNFLCVGMEKKRLYSSAVFALGPV
jgi:hypothetical protein